MSGEKKDGGVGRGRTSSRQMRVITPDGADAEATTKVHCPVCKVGIVSAAIASRVRDILRRAGIDIDPAP